MEKYKNLIELARRDENLYARIVWYKDDCIEEVAEFELRSENVRKDNKFIATIHNLVVDGLDCGAKFSIIDKD